MNLEAVPAFASNVCPFSEKIRDPDSVPYQVVGRPLCGPFHIVFTLGSEDGVNWMLKISADGHRFDSVAAAAGLISEARTMQLLKRETAISVPAVYAFEASSCSDLNRLFILTEHTEGKALYQSWFDDGIPKTRP